MRVKFNVSVYETWCVPAYMCCVCICVCVHDGWARNSYPFSTNRWNQEHELINRCKVARKQQKWQMKKKCPVIFESLRKTETAKIATCFFRFSRKCKKKRKEIHKEKRRWYLLCLLADFLFEPCISDLYGPTVQRNSELAREINGNQ